MDGTASCHYTTAGNTDEVLVTPPLITLPFISLKPNVCSTPEPLPGYGVCVLSSFLGLLSVYHRFGEFHLLGIVKVTFWLLFIRSKIVLVLLAQKSILLAYVSPYNISVYPFIDC